ncbi:oligosaccharide flippase family protein [Leucobacter iarius]|uniref:Lipopolysaccharide biosynthesis protein n=1 Tax=Leucobacter iarius TaxID=333963 RepID=A0ABP4Y6K3_9MICO
MRSASNPGRMARGAVTALSGVAVRFAVQLVGMVTIARLLGPEQYGAAAIVLLASALSELLRTTGIATVVIQRAHAGPRRLSLLSGAALIQGAIAAAIAGGCGFLLSTTLPIPPPGPLLIAATFLASSIPTVPMALMTRRLHLGRVMTLEVASTAAGTAGAIAIAVTGGGSLALFAQPLIGALVLAVLSSVAAPIRPRFTRHLHRVLGDLGFAANVLTVQLLNTVTRNADKTLVSLAFGPTAAGLFTQASQLLTIPLDQVGGALQRVALPAMSRAARIPGELLHAYRSTVLASTAILWPLFGALGVLAPALIEFLFGASWAGSVPLFRALLLAGCAQSIGYVTVWLFIATGRVRAQTLWTVFSRPIVLASFLLGIPWGPTGMAWAFSICSTLATLPALLIATRDTGIRLRDLFQPLLWPALSTALAVAGASSALALSDGRTDAPAGVLALGALGTVIGFLCPLLLPRRRRLAREFLRTLIRRQKPAPPRFTAPECSPEVP